MTKIIDAPATFIPQQAIAFGAIGGQAIAVDHDQPLPVESGVEGTAGATIPSGGALTAVIDLARQRLHRIIMPAGWTSAAISFQSSVNGVNFNDLHDLNGEVTIASSVAGAGRAIVVDPAIFYGIRYLKLRSGTAASPVNQAADRVLTLATVAR